MLETSRLLLRPYTPADWERVHLYASDPDFSRFEVWGPNSVDETRQFVAKCVAQMASTPVRNYQLAVDLKETGLLIGGCTLNLEGSNFETGYLGYAINPDFQNKGFATEAANALIRFGFDRLGLVSIHSICDTRNTASRRVMEKAGMQRTAVLTDERVRKGQMTDSYRYEIQAPAAG